ncbi:uncharacterized protein LOC132551957 [Ylistrum balloti]|uniref:uncharacterized protein LOC132551957 n=1 Tax=Ylistrum balloti TaxID=509963 RepID=UPI002905F7A0|nr:uncharacterized protein LOC132551957 [Ylistrum balloti]
MVHTCVVYGCTNRANDRGTKRGFYGFPTVRLHEDKWTEELSRERRTKWIAAIGRKDFVPSTHSKVCSDHFLEGKPSKIFDKANPDWVPSLKLNRKLTSPTTPSSQSERFQRANQRDDKRKQHLAARALMDLSTCSVQDSQPQVCDWLQKDDKPVHFFKLGPLFPAESAKDLMEVRSQEKEELLKKLNAECQERTTENLTLRQHILEGQIFSEDAFRDNDKKVNCFTGLPGFLTLMTVFDFVKDYIPDSGRVTFSKFQRFIMTLMKLRLTLSLQFLGYIFNISQPTASRTFLTVLDVLYIRLREFVYWPEREELRLSMPMEFRKHFGLKVAVIIDCFEIFIERPSNLLARAKTWSSYKHHNTVKILIGIAPQGCITYLSNAWGGRSSDKYIVENSGFLKKLLPGDIVLADRGFDIQESVGVMCAEVKIPSFTKGKSQLSALEVESTRNIAHVRIHVERVIGLVRNKFTILSDTLPVDYLIARTGDVPAVDKIVTVCCSLTNLCGSIVNFD